MVFRGRAPQTRNSSSRMTAIIERARAGSLELKSLKVIEQRNILTTSFYLAFWTRYTVMDPHGPPTNNLSHGQSRAYFTSYLDHGLCLSSCLSLITIQILIPSKLVSGPGRER